LGQLGTVAIVGVGLIGGSIGLFLRGERRARVVGIGRNENRLDEAARLGALDAFTTDLKRGVASADVVVVCTPVTGIAAVVREAAAHGPPGLLVTDAGSTKRTIVEAVERDDRARSTFVAAHPIAGSERQGATHADPYLFYDRVCVLTPTERTPADRLVRARDFWRTLGCRIVELDPATHDAALAATSHLPHAVSAALAAAVPADVLGLAAGAYRDGTRVARADAALWSGIFRENRDQVLHALTRFQVELHAFRRALEADDDAAIQDWWNAARSNRGQFDERYGKPAVED
jgi:prephenate dehydrogenase